MPSPILTRVLSQAAWPIPGATLDLDPVDNRYFVYGRGQAADVASLGGTIGLSTARTRVNAAGAIAEYAAGVLARAFDPITLACRGWRFDEPRTNYIRNNVAAGAAAGTPGTMPTYWSASTSVTGLTREIVGTTTEDGIPCVDVRIYGTPSAAGTYSIAVEQATSTPAAIGQTWTFTGYVRISAGTLSGITNLSTTITERNSGGSFLAGSATSTEISSGAIRHQRLLHTRTLDNASTAYVYPYFNINLTGAAVDITLRIGYPQMEQGSFATSVIRTSGATVARGTEVLSMAGDVFDAWYRPSGVWVVDFDQIGVPASAAGVILATSPAGAAGFNNAMYLARGSAAYANVGVAAMSNGVSQISPSDAISPPVGSGRYRLALRVRENDYGWAVNGSYVRGDASVAAPVIPPGRFAIGNNAWGLAGNPFSGHVCRIAFLPVDDASNDLLARLSA